MSLKFKPLSWVLWALLLYLGVWVLDWALWSAQFRPNPVACAQLQGQGACWGVIAEKWKILLFGRFPVEEVWRPALVAVAWTATLYLSLAGRLRPAALLALWLGVLAGTVPLMGVAPMALWGGLPLTLFISVLGMGLAFPLGVLLALGRRHGPVWLRILCASYIEVARALPLVSILFLAAFVLPLVLPFKALASSQDLLPRVILTIACFSAAYQAEVIRGGLQTVGTGQAQAALSLGLRPWQVQLHVVLPQAIRASLPGLGNSFITLFKDCSLVAVVSLFELTGSLGLALGGDVQWRPYYLEASLFVAGVYWVYCYGISRALR